VIKGGGRGPKVARKRVEIGVCILTIARGAEEGGRGSKRKNERGQKELIDLQNLRHLSEASDLERTRIETEEFGEKQTPLT